jgi:hypothetical protein
MKIRRVCGSIPGWHMHYAASAARAVCAPRVIQLGAKYQF